MTIHLFIIGVEKAGTTALFRHIAQSPFVYAHLQREMFFFLSEYEYQKGWQYAMEKYFSGYEKSNKNTLIVAKNVMQANSRESMVRLKKECPDVRCIIMLREPAERAYSAYKYAVLRGAEDCETFEDALELENKRANTYEKTKSNPLLYIRNSTYAPKLQAAFEVFGHDRILVIYHNEYKQNPGVQLARIEEFMGCDLFKDIEIDFKLYNKSARARFPLMAKWIYRFLQSRSLFKRLFRKILPHDKAAKLRHTILDFNRIDEPYAPIKEATADMIRKKVASDSNELVRLVGYCPWQQQVFMDSRGQSNGYHDADTTRYS